MAKTWKDEQKRERDERPRRKSIRRQDDMDRCDECRDLVYADSLTFKNGKWVCGFCA